jgi:hypothetical protein
MLAIDESVADRPDLQRAYFVGSLKLLRELAVTIDLNTALPRLSAFVSKMLPHDAFRMACFDQRGHLAVNASSGLTREARQALLQHEWPGLGCHARRFTFAFANADSRNRPPRKRMQCRARLEVTSCASRIE